MDYRKYQLSKLDLWIVFVSTVVGCLVIGLLFYRSLWSFLLFPIVFVVFCKRIRTERCTKRKEELQEQFINGMRVLSTSLQAGFSMENAWREVQKETYYMYGENAYFFKEVKEMNHLVSLNIPIERLVMEFSQRSGVDDIMRFAEIFSYGKRSGGNWKKIIDTTVFRMCEKYDAQKEIAVMVAGKKMEQQVMNLLPLGILAFLQLSAWDYMKVLFHNLLGVAFMTLCLLGYLGAILLSEKILQIKV